jgi:hypothetical protein
MSANEQTAGTVEKALLANPCAISYNHLVMFLCELTDGVRPTGFAHFAQHCAICLR